MTRFTPKRTTRGGIYKIRGRLPWFSPLTLQAAQEMLGVIGPRVSSPQIW